MNLYSPHTRLRSTMAELESQETDKMLRGSQEDEDDDDLEALEFDGPVPMPHVAGNR